MTKECEQLVVDTIEEAEEFELPPEETEQSQKPRLLVENCDPDRTVVRLRDILAETGVLYDRGVPVRLAVDQIQGGTVAQVMTPDALVLIAHTLCRPYCVKERDGGDVEVNARLPRTIATMYLEWRGEWGLPPLNGIASTPLLENDGTIHSSEGYDSGSGIWRENVPDLSGIIAASPTRADADAALRLMRNTFRTFCFADAETVAVNETGVSAVDIDRPPRKDESAFITGLLTAVCRSSLHQAPGILLRAAPMSGSGAGKGLLARCICTIAFGREPHAVTAGATAEELEKRVTAELINGSPVLFLDNLNNTALRSNLLASANHRAASPGQGARPVSDGPDQPLRTNHTDRQRPQPFRGSHAPLHHRRIRPAHGGSGGALVQHGYPERCNGPPYRATRRCPDHLAVGTHRKRHQARPAHGELRAVVPLGP
jgi:hypothetical protein